MFLHTLLGTPSSPLDRVDRYRSSFTLSRSLRQFLVGRVHPAAAEFAHREALHDLVVAVAAGDLVTVDHASGDAIASIGRYAHAHPVAVRRAVHPGVDVVVVAEAAEAADEAPRALMMAAPRCCTIGMNLSLYQASSTSESADLPPTVAWCGVPWWDQEQ